MSRRAYVLEDGNCPSGETEFCVANGSLVVGRRWACLLEPLAGWLLAVRWLAGWGGRRGGRPVWLSADSGQAEKQTSGTVHVLDLPTL